MATNKHFLTQRQTAYQAFKEQKSAKMKAVAMRRIRLNAFYDYFKTAEQLLKKAATDCSTGSHEFEQSLKAFDAHLEGGMPV